MFTEQNNTFIAWYQELSKPENYSKAKALYIEELEALAGDKDEVKSYLNFNIAIGRKV